MAYSAPKPCLVDCGLRQLGVATLSVSFQGIHIQSYIGIIHFGLIALSPVQPQSLSKSMKSSLT